MCYCYMSTRFSLTLLISQDHFTKGLSDLLPYEDQNPGMHVGPYSFITPTPILEIAKTLPQLYESVNIVTNESDKTSWFSVSKKDTFAIALVPMAQRIYPVTWAKKYVFLAVGLELPGFKEFISGDHPSLAFLFEVLRILKPIYGGMDVWTANPDDYWSTHETIEVPWHMWSLTQILGEPLTSAVKKHFDLDAAENGLFYCKNLGSGLYFITQPGTLAERYGPDPQNEIVKQHQAAARKLFATLQNIPAAILDEAQS
jgi:hypothetical protein